MHDINDLIIDKISFHSACIHLVKSSVLTWRKKLKRTKFGGIFNIRLRVIESWLWKEFIFSHQFLKCFWSQHFFIFYFPFPLFHSIHQVVGVYLYKFVIFCFTILNTAGERTKNAKRSKSRINIHIYGCMLCVSI